MWDSAMNGIDLVAKLAEIQSQYADAHRPMRSIEQYRERHARRHPERNDDGERHVSQYQTRQQVEDLPARILLKGTRDEVMSVESSPGICS
jgi:hypothetical protein